MSNTTIGHTAAESPGGAVAALASVLPVLLLGSKTCAALGCTTHHVSQQSCQCNAHCVLHNDCCEDFEAACPNVTLTNHTSSSGDANSTKSSHERGAKHPKSDSTAEAAGANTRPVHEKVHEKAHEPGSSTPDNKAERGKSDKGAAAAAADDEKPDADSTKAAHEAHEKQPKQPSHSAGGRSDKPQEAAKAAEKDKAGGAEQGGEGQGGGRQGEGVTRAPGRPVVHGARRLRACPLRPARRLPDPHPAIKRHVRRQIPARVRHRAAGAASIA